MIAGKLYRFGDGEFIANIKYQFLDESKTSWWGELVLSEYKAISDGNNYMIELKDGRRGRCSLKKRVNRAVTGVPPRYHFHFRGFGPLKPSEPK